MGIGYKFDTSNTTSVYTMLNYVDISSDFGGDDGYQFAVGARTQLSKQTQVYGEVGALDMDKISSRTELRFGLRQEIADDFGAYIEYKRDDFSNEGFGLGLTVNF